MAKRRGGYGEVRHGQKPAAWRVKHGPGTKTVGLSARVYREVDGSYTAITCPLGKGTRARWSDRWVTLRRRCGEGNGRSPTKALKKSLAALARKL